jgi:hypothetical protein
MPVLQELRGLSRKRRAGKLYELRGRGDPLTEAKPPAITGVAHTAEATDTMWSLPGVRVMKPDEKLGPFPSIRYVRIDGNNAKAGWWKAVFIHGEDCAGFRWKQIVDPSSRYCGVVQLFYTGRACDCDVKVTMTFLGELAQINNLIPPAEIRAHVCGGPDGDVDVVLVDSK